MSEDRASGVVGKLKRVLGAKVSVVWVVILVVMALAVGGFLTFDWTRNTSVCDAQSHPEVSYAFTYGDSDGEFYIFEKNILGKNSGTVYETDTAYSPPRERLERDKGWRRVPSGRYLRMWAEGGTFDIYPGGDYATFREYGSNSTRRIAITDCAGSGVL